MLHLTAKTYIFSNAFLPSKISPYRGGHVDSALPASKAARSDSLL